MLTSTSKHLSGGRLTHQPWRPTQKVLKPVQPVAKQHRSTLLDGLIRRAGVTNEDAPAWDIGRDEGPSADAPWKMQPPMWFEAVEAALAKEAQRVWFERAEQTARLIQEAGARAKERADLIAAADEAAPAPAQPRARARL